jgi:transitional endoplasmic reticulum ATPase
MLAALGISEGEVIEIVGKRRTPAIAMRLPYEDRGLEVLRIDDVQRANAGVAIGEQVVIDAAPAKSAVAISLAPKDMMHSRGVGESFLREFLMGRPMNAGDTISLPEPTNGNGRSRLGLQEIQFVVAATEPRGVVVRITNDTRIAILPRAHASDGHDPNQIAYADLGGLDDAIAQLREVIVVALRQPELFGQLGIDPPRGVLLHGPPGSGKTLLARAVACEESVRYFYVGGPEIMAPRHGESEERLRDVFRQARANAPAIIFMDDIDALAPRRDATYGETERRVVTQLLTLLDGLEPRGRVMVIGATNRPEALDEALRRPGRFDREIAIGAPSAEGRRQILAVHTRAMPLDADVDLVTLSDALHGFVGADIAALVREAAMEAFRRHVGGAPVTPSMVEGLRVSRVDFVGAQRRVKPSAMREIMVHVPETTWDDVGGLDAVRRTLTQGIELPLRMPGAFRRFGIRPAKGFLLFGPPGTGKTLIARAVAHESSANFISVKTSDLLSKWYGESERQISRLFARARQVAPSIVFIDELDGLASERGSADDGSADDRVVNTLLAELDGLEGPQGVMVIAATNRPAVIDPALLRPGRFDELIYVPPPDIWARLRILELHTARVPLAADVDRERLVSIAERTEGFTGADLEALVRRAVLTALAECETIEAVGARFFEAALITSRPSVSPEMVREYESLASTLRRVVGRRAIGFGPA